jgi:hypothetical protein
MAKSIAPWPLPALACDPELALLRPLMTSANYSFGLMMSGDVES